MSLDVLWQLSFDMSEHEAGIVAHFCSYPVV